MTSTHDHDEGAANLYSENVLDHASHPRNKGRLEPHTFSHRDMNPSCGDKIDLFVRLGADGRVEAAMFDGHGCAVSQAAVSMLTEDIVGKTIAELESMDGEVIIEMLGIPVGPSRMNCAMLGLKTLKGALTSHKLSAVSHKQGAGNISETRKYSLS
jgi:nitrogen fixation NifU-like protein